jgi:hypothetical protein
VVGAEISLSAPAPRRAIPSGLAFLIYGHMSVSVSAQGGLMLRCDPEQTDALVAKPHAGPTVMRGRELDGWLRVDAEGVRTKAQLQRWISRSVDYALTLR